MKFEVVIYLIVACLTLTVPCTAYLALSSELKEQSASFLKQAQKSDAVAKSIEDGKVKIYIESIPAAMRLQANAERALSNMFLDFKSASNHFLFAALGIAVLQLSLLLAVLVRRRNLNLMRPKFVNK